MMMPQLPSLVLAQADLMEHVLPHPVTRQLTNHMLMMLVVAGLLIIIFSYVGMRAKATLIPTGTHNFFEAMLSFLRTDLIRPALGENSDRFTPFIWTVFFFILFCNVLGLIPINEVLTLIAHPSTPAGESHLWGTATANFSVTGGLAVIAFVTVHISGIVQSVRVRMDPSLAPHHHGNDHAQPHGHGQMHGSEGIEDERDVVLDHHVGDGHDHAHGVHHSKEFHGEPFPVALITGFGMYFWNFAPHPQMGWKVLDVAMWGFLLILELAGSLVKPISLCVRLFANMLAGHLVLAALVAMIPFVNLVTHVAEPAYKWGPISLIVIAGCAALSLLELFVAFLQAYIFTFLTTLYIASAVAPEH